MARILQAIVGLAAFGLAGCGGGEDEKPSLAVSGGKPIVTVRVTTDEHFLSPQYTRLGTPGTYTLQVENEGILSHSLRVEHDGRRLETPLLAPGERYEVGIDLTDTGEYTIYCPVEGHRAKGMAGLITVGL